MKLLFASDSFKGSLTSEKTVELLSRAAREVFGELYDCDFNQAADMKVTTKDTIFDIAEKPYEPRTIYFDKHCYACTAGAGSSCGGTTEA